MNYFEFFELPISFSPDLKLLKKRFYANSKKYHPDFFTMEDESKKADILELSTYNNNAYKTLSDADKCIKYVLNLKGIIQEEGENKLPQSFLMDMMEINEALMDLQFDPDIQIVESVKSKISLYENQLYGEVKNYLQEPNIESLTKESLQKVKDFYFKRKYLLRIKENLDKLARAEERL